MGFGLLFLGYLMMFNIPYIGIDVLPDLWGLLLMYWGLMRLSPYGRDFLHAKNVLYPLLLLEAAKLAAILFETYGAGSFDYVGDTVDLLKVVLIFIFTYYLLSGIRRLSASLELPKIAVRARRNFIIGAVYYALTFVVMLKLPVFAGITAATGGILYLIGWLWLALNSVLIFSCYMRICLEGDEDMPDYSKSILKNNQL